MKRQHLASLLSVVALVAGSAGTRAQAVTFTPPSSGGAPSQATGGASRGSFFTPTTGKGAPSQATGGASRGSFFTPTTGNGAPSQTTGGASRGSLFTPTAGKGTPQQATGGASRGSLFAPTAGKGTPQQATGGASRGQLFAPTSSSGAPQQAAGGASRVGTYYLNQATVRTDEPAALIALLPQNFYGTTVSEHPTVLVYLPASNAEEAVFSLKDEAGNTHYQMTVPVAGKIGVVAIALPADAPALKVGKNYHWFLALKVDAHLSPATPYVDGWIQRVQPNADLSTAMQQQDALKRAAALGKHGVWYDCVATLASLYATQPPHATLTEQWTELLSSAGLQEIKTAPVLAAAR